MDTPIVHRGISSIFRGVKDVISTCSSWRARYFFSSSSCSLPARAPPALAGFLEREKMEFDQTFMKPYFYSSSFPALQACKLLDRKRIVECINESCLMMDHFGRMLDKLMWTFVIWFEKSCHAKRCIVARKSLNLPHLLSLKFTCFESRKEWFLFVHIFLKE